VFSGMLALRMPRTARAPRLDVVSVLREKRDGGVHAPATIRALVDAYLAGEATDYQLSAWLMAAWLNGLDRRETLALTEAMLLSGDVLELRSVSAPKVDKHSTGGVGDKISLCLAPLVAACGVAVPMISGRGLGHTGGTLDKLEAITGFDVRLSAARFERIVREVGVCMIGQTDRLAPADRRLYALRDVTATVESVPLIVASILSKKLAEGIDGLVLDVKCGGGAFMATRERAEELARALVGVGRRAGKRVTALITEMDQPIGATIGNALETREAIDVLRGEGPDDSWRLTRELGAEMLRVAGVERSAVAARAAMDRARQSGAGMERFLRMVKAQGGDVRQVEQPERLPRAPHRVEVRAPRAGVVTSWDARALGLLAIELGAGRRRAEDPVDHAVGIELCCTVDVWTRARRRGLSPPSASTLPPGASHPTLACSGASRAEPRRVSRRAPVFLAGFGDPDVLDRRRAAPYART
jgi:pyrimidine-nucleoside phosphorylase